MKMSAYTCIIDSRERLNAASIEVFGYVEGYVGDGSRQGNAFSVGND